MEKQQFECMTICPLDGRYAGIKESLAEYFSEYALTKYRVYVEVQWLKFLIDTLEDEILAKFDRAEIVGQAMARFEKLYAEFLAEGGTFAPFRERYCRKCLNIGKEVRVIGRETYLATALDITPEGELIVKRMDNGAEEVVFSGEVSIREKEK